MTDQLVALAIEAEQLTKENIELRHKLQDAREALRLLALKYEASQSALYVEQRCRIELLKKRNGRAEAAEAALRAQQWTKVTPETMPQYEGEFWGWHEPRPIEECPTDTSGNPIVGKFEPHGAKVKTFRRQDGTFAFNCGGLSKVTYFRALPPAPAETGEE